MGTEIKVWQIKDEQLIEIQEDDLAASHLEKDLEDWIEKDTSLLGTKLLVIARQYDIPDVGRLDLLGIDEEGTLVLVELKRDLSSRETVAQILDYASWLDTCSEEDIENCARHLLGEKSLSDAFQEHFFDKDLETIAPQKHRMLVVTPKLDSSAERIINYLAERHGLDINAIFFRHAKTAQGDEVLIRTVLGPDKMSKPRGPVVTTAGLQSMAKERKTTELVEICRKLAVIAEEKARSTYEGSFRYKFADRIVFGANVSGARCNTPIGQLDVWIRVPTMSNIVGLSEQEIRSVLKRSFETMEGGGTDCIIRLKSPKQAEELMSLIRNWLTKSATSRAGDIASSTNQASVVPS